MCDLSSGSHLSLVVLYGHDDTHWDYNESFPQLKHEEVTAIMNVLKGGQLQGLCFHLALFDCEFDDLDYDALTIPVVSLQ